MSENDELKPCPFCGGTNVSICSDTYWGGGDYYSVECFDCNANGPDRDLEAEAIAAWNRRAEGDR